MIVKTIQYLLPAAQFVVRGEPTTQEEYVAQVTWHDTRRQPSWAEIEAARPAAETAAANAVAQAARRAAFQVEADPLFFAWQRGEGTEAEWLDKCAEIRARYPYT